MEAQKEAIEPRRCDSMMTDKARQNAAKYSVDPPREKKKKSEEIPTARHLSYRFKDTK